jgi:hypothetical protein
MSLGIQKNRTHHPANEKNNSGTHGKTFLVKNTSRIRLAKGVMQNRSVKPVQASADGCRRVFTGKKGRFTGKKGPFPRDWPGHSEKFRLFIA